jgi:pimeloyl-ACP methyl ester carboxylesterase
VIGAIVVASAACDESGNQIPTNTVQMHFDRPNTFFDAPFPSDDLIKSDGTIDISAFPNPQVVPLVDLAKQMIDGQAKGFASEGGIFFTTTGTIDLLQLPTMAQSITASSSVMLVNVTKTSPDYLKPVPIEVTFTVDGGPFGAPNLLGMLPLQGAPLRPNETYAAVVRTEAGVSQSSEMAQIIANHAPTNMSAAVLAEDQSALSALASIDIPNSDVAGLAVFTTADPTADFSAVQNAMLAAPLPTPTAPFHQTDLFDNFCVYSTTIGMPDYQSGTPPFSDTGGNWAYDASGNPILQRTEPSNFVVTIPRSPMPAAGYPMTIFIRTGGGGDRPLVDRGPQAVTNGPPIAPGTGPALYFAMSGFAGASVDGPLGGLRNTTNGNEDFLIFNIFNPPALRDSIRESAVELVLFTHIMMATTLDVSDCAGAGLNGAGGIASFDATHFGLMGHSMGATIAPLVVANEPKLSTLVLSGAGASWIENVIYKLQPLAVKPDMETLLGYAPLHRSLTETDPVLTLFQWAEEPADPLVYTRKFGAKPDASATPRNILMEQGIVDHYIMPPIANATSLSLGLDLAGQPLDATTPEIASLPSLESELVYSGGIQIPLPVTSTQSHEQSATTAVVIQHPADGIEDGHEIVFQTDPPKREYRCFLLSSLTGTPRVPAPGDVLGPCE